LELDIRHPSFKIIWVTNTNKCTPESPTNYSYCF